MDNKQFDINVRELLGVMNEPLFIKAVGPDKLEAAKRQAITEHFFEDWFTAINATNTRQLPSGLVALYDKAACTLCEILAMEKKIATGTEGGIG